MIIWLSYGESTETSGDDDATAAASAGRVGRDGGVVASHHINQTLIGISPSDSKMSLPQAEEEKVEEEGEVVQENDEISMLKMPKPNKMKNMQRHQQQYR